MEKLKKFLSNVKDLNVVTLTGAGISAESGVKTFRDNGGLWENYRIEDVATPMAFERNPDLVYRFYNERRKQAHSVKPNKAHFALAEISKLLGNDFHLVTQNVDDLHERAGSKDVIHMHGELFKARCLNCGKVVECGDILDASSKCKICGAGMRPHIVWFHEMPFFMDKIHSLLSSCNLFIAIGTSGVVYPAAGFYQIASSNTFTLEINLKATSGNFDEVMEGLATAKVSELKELIEKYYF